MPVAEPAPGNRASRPLNGQCLKGHRGTLAVVLSPETLAQVRQTAVPTHWLIPVDDSALVEAAAQLPGEVFWLCRRQPKSLLGQLEDGLHGVWLEPHAVVVNLDGQLRRFSPPPPSRDFPALEYLARVFAKVWTGNVATAPLLPPLKTTSRTQTSTLCNA
jgi:hypothetical protein